MPDERFVGWARTRVLLTVDDAASEPVVCMVRVSTDRKVYMEPEEEHSIAASSSATKGIPYSNTYSSSSNNNNSSNIATIPTTEGGSSTFRNGLKKLSSLNINNRKKAFLKLGSQNGYEQLLEERQPPSSDTTHVAANGIFSIHHRSNTFCTFGRSSHSNSDEVVVRIDDPSSPGAEPTSNLRNSVGGRPFSGGPRQSSMSISRTAELVVNEQPPSCPHEPLLRELDSFDVTDEGDEHLSRRSTGCSPSAAADGAGDGVNPAPGMSPSLKRVEFTEPTRREDGGGSQGIIGSGIQSEGSYDFRNDSPLPRRQGSSGIEATNSSRRKKAKSFDFGTVVEDDPPTKLIGAFLRRQSESGSNFLDLDLEMDELTPISTLNEGNLSPLSSDLEEQTPSPERNSFVKDTSYQDLVSLDPPVTNSVPISFKPGAQTSPTAEVLRRWKALDPLVTSSVPTLLTAGAQSSPTEEVLRRWKAQTLKDESAKCHSDPLSFPQEGKHDVRINVQADERFANGREESPRGAAASRTTSPENGTGGLESPTGVRWRRNGTFRPNSSLPKTSAEEEVAKAPAQYVVKPSFSKQKSRLADLPKPPSMTKVSGVIDEQKVGSMLKSGQVRNSKELKSGLMGNKLKKVQEEEEEDPLKVTDMPEKYRKREKSVWTILEYSALLCIIAALVCVLVFPTLRRKNLASLALWKWVLLVMVVFCGNLISGWIVWVVVFIIEKNFLLRKRVVYFVYALRKSVKNCLWLGLALLAWHFMIDPKVNNRKAVTYVTKVLVCFLVAAFIVLFKTLIVKCFASSFHVNNYFERIQEALFNQYIMETLAGPPMIEYEQDLEDEKRLIEEIAGLRDAGASGPSLSKVQNLPPVARTSGLPPRPSVGTKSGMIGSYQQKSGLVGKSQIGRSPKVDGRKKKSATTTELNLGISVDHLQKLDLTNISAWNMKRLMHILRNSTLTHSLEETVNAAEGAETEIQSEWQAKSAAKQIFKNVAKPGQCVIMEDDLLRFMYEEEMKKVLSQFDGASEKNCITKQALKKWVIAVYKERRALALSLNDTKTAVNKLHRMVDVVVGIIIIVIWLLVLGIATTKLLLFLSSQILLLILVWGNTLKTIFEAVVFLFVMHPFDVGDRCVIDGTQLVVEEMNILTTVFIGDFDVKVSFPNSVLATKPIQNFYRSPEMGDGVDFIVQASTPVEKIASFKEKIGVYIRAKANHWNPDYSLNVVQMTEGERMKLSLGVKHTINYQDMGEIVKRRSELLLEVQFCLQELGIEYHLPAQEVHVRQRTD